MKKKIAYRLCILILVSMFVIALICYHYQVKSAQENVYANSIIRINQVKQILINNDEEIEKLNENLKEDYFIRAKAAAYIVQNHPELVGNQSELKKIASLLQIDEFHMFDKEGRLYAGTEPKYYNYTFHSGEQMEFFLPMLEDDSLQLCQDVRPNTAEQKLMQYAAVWREDHQGIVQIGMAPTRLLEALRKNELSHIFTMVTTADKDSTYFAIDLTTGEILGSTNSSLEGRRIGEFGITLPIRGTDTYESVWDIDIDEVKNYCVIQLAGNMVVGVSRPYKSMYQNIPYNMALIILSLSILSAIIVLLILRMLDYYIIHGLHKINHDMEKIALGDLDYRVKVADVPEFTELSGNINYMVDSLLENTGKLSWIFQNVNIPIAVYEYNMDMKRVLATSKIGDILAISEEEMKKVLSNQGIFIQKMKQVCKGSCEQEEDIYLIGETNSRYVKIKSYHENRKTLGVIVDVTEDMIEKQQIKYERDMDFLTGLSSRRAYFNEMDRLFQTPKDLNIAVLLMIDADNLKYVNDNWGHEFGDMLLSNIAEVLKSSEVPNKLAARLSGDEFALFWHSIDSVDDIQKYIDMLYTTMKDKTIQISEQTTIPVSFSCGYVVFQAEEVDYKNILKIADQTMYQAKKNKKGQFVRCDMISPKQDVID